MNNEEERTTNNLSPIVWSGLWLVILVVLMFFTPGWLLLVWMLWSYVGWLLLWERRLPRWRCRWVNLRI